MKDTYQVISNSYKINLQRTEITVAFASLMLTGLIVFFCDSHHKLDGYALDAFCLAIGSLIVCGILGLYSLLANVIHYEDKNKDEEKDEESSLLSDLIEGIKGLGNKLGSLLHVGRQVVYLDDGKIKDYGDIVPIVRYLNQRALLIFKVMCIFLITSILFMVMVMQYIG